MFSCGAASTAVLCVLLLLLLCSARVGVDNIRVWEETTLAAANKLEEERRAYDEQVRRGEGGRGHALNALLRCCCVCALSAAC